MPLMGNDDTKKKAKMLCNPDTEWLSKAQFGAFMHYLPDQEQFMAISQFDVEGLAEQLQWAGAGYLGFTLGQNTGFINAPNPVYDEVTGYAVGERCSRRDLPMEIAEALRKRGMKFMLYLPCQTPNRDLTAVRAFGFPEEPKDGDRKIVRDAAVKWASVIEWWAEHYGDLVSGWWFDGGYVWCDFNDDIAELYARAVKKGNPHAIVTFNPGIGYKCATRSEDYVAGELPEPFRMAIDSRWLDGSQAHVLTFMGETWGFLDEARGKSMCRYIDDMWIVWLKRCFRAGCAVTMDMGVNREPTKGRVGVFCQEQIEQFRRLREATRG